GHRVRIRRRTWNGQGAIDKCGIRLRLCFGGMGTRLLFAHLAGRGVLPILLLQPLLPVGLRRPLLGDGKANAAEKDQSERAGSIKIALHVCASFLLVRLASAPCANECPLRAIARGTRDQYPEKTAGTAFGFPPRVRGANRCPRPPRSRLPDRPGAGDC